MTESEPPPIGFGLLGRGRVVGCSFSIFALPTRTSSGMLTSLSARAERIAQFY